MRAVHQQGRVHLVTGIGSDSVRRLVAEGDAAEGALLSGDDVWAQPQRVWDALDSTLQPEVRDVPALIRSLAQAQAERDDFVERSRAAAAYSTRVNSPRD